MVVSQIGVVLKQTDQEVDLGESRPGPELSSTLTHL